MISLFYISLVFNLLVVIAVLGRCGYLWPHVHFTHQRRRFDKAQSKRGRPHHLAALKIWS